MIALILLAVVAGVAGLGALVIHAMVTLPSTFLGLPLWLEAAMVFMFLAGVFGGSTD